MASQGTRYKEEQIIRIPRELDSGTSVAEVCRQYRSAKQTTFRLRNGCA